jgi:hypothetical protein
MDLSELIDKLDSFSISSADDIVLQIINFMYESAEVGLNNYTYYFKDSSNVQTIIQNLITYFPDIHIKYTPNTNYIYIDWS